MWIKTLVKLGVIFFTVPSTSTGVEASHSWKPLCSIHSKSTSTANQLSDAAVISLSCHKTNNKIRGGQIMAGPVDPVVNFKRQNFSTSFFTRLAHKSVRHERKPVFALSWQPHPTCQSSKLAEKPNCWHLSTACNPFIAYLAWYLLLWFIPYKPTTFLHYILVFPDLLQMSNILAPKTPKASKTPQVCTDVSALIFS